MLIKHKIDPLEPTSKTYLFIELHLEDFRCRNSIANRIIELSRLAKGQRRANVLRLVRNMVTPEMQSEFEYLDKLSTRYKQCLIRSKFNYAYRSQNNFRGNGRFKPV